MLVLNKLERLLTVCKVKNIDDIDLSKEFYFIGKTDEGGVVSVFNEK